MIGFLRVHVRKSFDMLKSILLFAILVLQVLCNHKFAGKCNLTNMISIIMKTKFIYEFLDQFN